MKHFGIYSPVLGLRKDFPSVLLDKAFTPDAENIRYWHGEIQTAKLRRKMFMRQSFACSPSLDIIYVSGDITPSIPDGSDIVLFDVGNGYHDTYTAIDVAYDSNTDRTVLTATGGQIFCYPQPASGGGFEPGPRVALYTDGLETDPNEAAFMHVPVPDAGPVLRFFDLLDDESTLYLFAFTPTSIYLWNTVTTAWITAFTGKETDHWSATSFNGRLIATNNQDAPVVWDGTVAESSFSTLSTAIDNESTPTTVSRAKFVTTFESHVVFGNYSLSSGENFYNGLIWSNLDDHEDWRQDVEGTDAGAAYVDGNGVIDGGFGQKGDILYVFKDKSIRLFWYTGTELIFNSRGYNVGIGSVSPDSIINDADGNLYFYASDMTFREVDSGIISRPLGDDLRNLVQDKTLQKGIRSVFIAEYGEIWWAVPYGADADSNNVVFCYKQGIWSRLDLAVSAFGHYRESETVTWDALPFSQWDEWSWPSWDSPEGVQGWPLDICAGYDNRCYLSHAAYHDNNEPYTSYFVLTTDLGDLQLLRWYKRLLAIQVWLQKEGDEALTLSIKRDDEVDWQPAGTITVSEQTHDVLIKRFAVDFRAKRFLIKIESTRPFRFLGIEFDYLLAGER
jgi:hypothetical protein